MDIAKRKFLAAGAIAGAGIAASLGSEPGAAQVPAGVPKATGRTMVDSPSYFGTASKGGGFKKGWARTLAQPSAVDPNYKPRRFNKAIELWEDNQVAFYDVYMPSGAGDGYEEGKRMSQTWADSINYEMENGCFDFADLRNFMQGLVDGGPTPVRSPHADGLRHPAGSRVRRIFDARQCLADPAIARRRCAWRTGLRDAVT